MAKLTVCVENTGGTQLAWLCPMSVNQPTNVSKAQQLTCQCLSLVPMSVRKPKSRSYFYRGLHTACCRLLLDWEQELPTVSVVAWQLKANK